MTGAIQSDWRFFLLVGKETLTSCNSCKDREDRAGTHGSAELIIRGKDGEQLDEKLDAGYADGG